MQTTVKSDMRFDGVGLHSGRAARMVIRPAAAEQGIWFRRTDVESGDALIPARWDAVEVSPLCTRLVNRAGLSVSTVEHVMAALAGTGIHNALIEIDGPEVPILDGSSAPFVQAILARGARRLPAPVRALEIRSEIRVETDAGWAALAPSDSFEMAFDIDFPDAAIGRQRLDLDLSNGAFVRELCDARTFCRQSDVATMRANGLALGGTLRNAVVVEGDRVLSPGGLRRADEAVRHKMLDAVGDLALAGGPVFGRYTGHRAGHALTNMLLRKLFTTPGAVRMVSCDPARAARLPGVGAELAQMPAVA
ncbi:UDP-3-O-[3-hydroxymyristoyl] N-acetylglucosamine deacetylase [Rhodosalinus halophilus]|uniref:UDP-3-O-acyl-N-acetylglucosamine deacetylase n=1 Tax=Rhodosalinus halophilus TaxID=2259333 RepID=A0A365UEN5_9RHOB|nr:UDP-3-O-acyl-N-acetylglucosamine deacetylase [Rhodosalinus halophilus]RBI87414.1 UDP-3-O-[3-hydroxymyristoyl] N-acetylglucosamine deacetylase [Rhodosalinus halophilus]